MVTHFEAEMNIPGEVFILTNFKDDSKISKYRQYHGCKEIIFRLSKFTPYEPIIAILDLSIILISF
ncbi:uncharacterized protein METZ01_LOCUS113014 [marine metagenome]|jgi:hypothetical protein|uniref:Uncharacterized protein n=1 Tax=marine metagenome TaxID=408172 RepID=A0A381X6B0_9ZZZZ